MVPFRKKENFKKTVLRLKILIFSKWHYLKCFFFKMALFECFFFQYHSPKILLLKWHRKKRNSNGAFSKERKFPKNNIAFANSSFFKMALFECFVFQYHSPKILLLKWHRKKRNTKSAFSKERKYPKNNIAFANNSFFKIALFKCFVSQYHSPTILLFSKWDRKKRNSNGAFSKERKFPKNSLAFENSSFFKMALFECFVFQYHSPKILLLKWHRKKR